MVGDTLGHYRIVRPLGSGGMGEVFLAHDARLDRDVALKRLPETVAADPERRARFEREARAVAALDHPNIVTVFAVEEADGVPFFTMQYVEGRTLQAVIPAQGLPLQDLLRLAIPLTDAVAAAHVRGILHRDLKPANVMVTPEGRVKVLDFGLAKLQEESAPDGLTRTVHELTGEGRIVGTVAYMSPEQAEGRPLDARSDVFALGVLLYEMATGQRPFAGETSASVIAAILRDTPAAVTALRPELPRDLARIVTRALTKDPEHRYQTAKDLRNDLEGLKAELDSGALEGRSTAGPAVGSGLAGAVAPTPSSGTGSAVDSGVTVPATRSAPSVEPVSASWLRRQRALLGAAAAVLVIGVGVTAWLWPRKPAPAPTAPALDPKRVVVTVFENRTGDASLDALGVLAAERISEGLPQVESVQVVPSATAVEASRVAPGGTPSQGEDPVRRLAAATGAGLVVSGAFHLEGNDLRVRARLTDAATGTFTVIEPAPSPRDTPMAAIDAARERVMGAVAVRFDPTGSPTLAGAAPAYPAYREYLAARALLDVNQAAALERLNRALELDPEFVAARFSLIGNLPLKEKAKQVAILEAQWERLSPVQRLWLTEDRALLAGRNEQAFVAAREAARLIPPSPENNRELAYFAVITGHYREALEALTAPLDWKRMWERPGEEGGVYFFNLAEVLHLLGDHERELAEVRRGVAVNPDLVYLRRCEGMALAALGRVDEVEHVVSESLAIAGEDHPSMLFEVAIELRTHGQVEAARALARRAVRWHRDHPPGKGDENRRYFLGLTLQLAEMWDEAQILYEKAAKEVPDNLDYQAALAWLAARRGDRTRAQRISDALGRVEQPYLRGRHTFLRAGIAAHLGDKDRAVDLLRDALAQGVPYSLHLHHDPGLQPLRGFAPYEALTKAKE